MFLLKLAVLSKSLSIKLLYSSVKRCHNVFGFKELIYQEKPGQFAMTPVTSEDHDTAIDVLRKYYLPDHVFVRARNMDTSNDCALDEYFISLLKQGNSLFARTDDDSVAGLCVNFASSPVDPKNLRNYAFYRQDPNTKDFLYFTAKLQETPNLWEIFNYDKVFEIKMLTILPEYRRQGLAVTLVERSKEQARDQAYNIIRMDCLNSYDYKIAERCMFQCLAKFPLHKIRGPHAPYIKRNSKYNWWVRVYIETRANTDVDMNRSLIKQKQIELENCIE